METTDPTAIEVETTEEESAFTSRMSGRTMHKDLYFDVPIVSPIAYNLFQGGCVNGLELPRTIEHLVSLYPWEKYKLTRELSSMLVTRMFDQQIESREEIEVLALWVNTCRISGPVLVHCQAGLNRSSLVVARAIMLDEGMSGNDVIDFLREKRSPAVLCNQYYEDYLRKFDG